MVRQAHHERNVGSTSSPRTEPINPMTHLETRPDPDALLRQIKTEEALAQRGRLKLFFGASAGVGKTYAMLTAARAAKAQGVSLIVGVVVTHGRVDTEAVAKDLPVLPMKVMPAAHGNGAKPELLEFDLDAALEFAKTHDYALILIDELAHSNAAGSRHPKRWQDVEELLDAGVDVWSTLNVQHLESLNDIVSGITGIRVLETVPDRVFDSADEVVVVDLPPDELLARLRAGKVYLPQQAVRAAANFFRKGNLLALRELALRRTADRVDDEMQAYRRTRSISPVWTNREALLACVSGSGGGEKIVRRCARLAAQMDLPWHALHVETPDLQQGSPAAQAAIRALKLASELGATTATRAGPNAAKALVRYAREHNLSRLVIGREKTKWPWQIPLAEQVMAIAGELDVLQIAMVSTASARASKFDAKQLAPPMHWRGYLAAALACGFTAMITAPLAEVLELSNIVMLFLLTVVGVALNFGRGPAVLAAFLGVGFFDFYFVEPRFSFAVQDAQYLLTFAVMLVVALVIGQLTAGLKVQAQAAGAREQRVRALYQMSRDLSAALMPEQVSEIGERFLQSEFGARSALLVADEDDRLVLLPSASLDGARDLDMSAAEYCFRRGEPAGRGTDTLPAGACLMLPLKAPMRLRGALAIQMATVPADAVQTSLHAGSHSRNGSGLVSPEQRQLLDTCASLLAISLERIHYVEVARASTVQIESERLRNSLLSAISHDLRTPLTALIGMAESLDLTKPGLSIQQTEIAKAIRTSALRMNTLVNNLLDMAKLEAGAVQLNKQWQPLEEVIGSALQQCQPLLIGRSLSVGVPDTLPLLNLDAVLMERVFVNLIENIAKYTPASSPVAISAALQGEFVEIYLDDFGAGLPTGREEAIFNKFERGQKESALPGVGLGLAICRAILRVHGGTIHGENRPEGGARFTIRFPTGAPPVLQGEAPAASRLS